MTAAPESAGLKSSYSNDSGGNCVEVADLTPAQPLIAVRDSKFPHGPALALPPDAFLAFVGLVRG
ncbi:protein of unknown function [Streptomyces sp. yr375]|uniref:DUF397 domain-containing protein n=1 Tax=Streptomyces sp. yr375 TaxID=1761906 RepID=UPI0008BCDA40|nr:DUF397 domain-containing protein [Streptomyces sp. yr375]SES46984.1 protein of unknown function [Streptomyces sp. yr375]